MTPIILFRKDFTTENEFSIANEYLEITESRVGIINRLVVGRYSVLPYYKELERDLKIQNSSLINSYQQHKYISDFDYYFDIEDLTPKTWFDFSIIPEHEKNFVVKGKTNSRKNQWRELMFSETKRGATEIACHLKNDSLIGQQDIVIRKFEKLKILDYSVNGMPFANEWRFFCFKDKVLSHGFYWTVSEKRGEINKGAFDLVREVIKRVKNKVSFYVVDVAEKENGSWIVIEMNDGQQSGTSFCDLNLLYSNLKKRLEV